MEGLHIICDRCKQVVQEAIKGGGFTGGYYEVGHGFWHQYANESEKHVCDDCMHKDPRYIKAYGSR